MYVNDQHVLILLQDALPRVPAGVGSGGMTSDERWLAAVWPFVQSWLPAAPTGVVEIGCGPLGGFVPMLRSAGYDAVGVDPEAPDGPWYQRGQFEDSELPAMSGAVVACTSLHHVADLGQVLDLTWAALAPDGVLVVVEWARERFDEATARWCFDRLPSDSGDENWLRRRREEWQASGLPWGDYCRGWAEGERMHAGKDIVRELDARFDPQMLGSGPYFFADLDGVTEADEQAAIDAGQIQAGRITYVGQTRRDGRRR
jgi:SAM-dependent methyltransferase